MVQNRPERNQVRTKRQLWTWLLVCGVAGSAVALATAVTMAEGLRWRAQLLSAKGQGRFPEIPLVDFVRWLQPNSPVSLRALRGIPNVHAAISNGFADDESADRGARVFADACTGCHGGDARGKTGPDLVTSMRTMTEWTYFATVKWGRAQTGMPAQPLTDREIWETHTYVRRLIRAADNERGGADRPARADINVEPAMIPAGTGTSDGWLTYAGNYAGHRHSGLSQISKKNIRDLRVAWAAQLPYSTSTRGSLQASPIVAGSLLFLSGPRGDVVAVNARTGGRVWRYERAVPGDLWLCCGAANRGVATLGDSIFVATLDAHLVALEASTGRLKWDVKVADFREGYSMGAAPLAVADRVIVGVSGGDFGARGFVAAFSAVDGHLLWKFRTVPEPGVFGHETWAADSWKNGGAATWITGAYDSELDLVYWGVGNATPMFRAEARAGDNLFSMCVIALELSSGKLRWYFQFSPGDEHGWDSTQQPIVAQIVRDGERVPALLWANRNGFFYVLDRRTGKFLHAKAFVKQTWAKGFEASGRPILNPEPRPSATGTVVWPWEEGGTNWEPPSLDPERHLVFVPTLDAAGIYFRTRERFERGRMHYGGASHFARQFASTSAVKAIEAGTGDIRWEARLEHGIDRRPGIAGILSTRGGLVFAGFREDFIAFDADTGQELWRLRLGGPIRAAPVAYSVDGREFIALAAGSSLFAFALPSERP